MVDDDICTDRITKHIGLLDTLFETFADCHLRSELQEAGEHERVEELDDVEWAATVGSGGLLW